MVSPPAQLTVQNSKSCRRSRAAAAARRSGSAMSVRNRPHPTIQATLRSQRASRTNAHKKRKTVRRRSFPVLPDTVTAYEIETLALAVRRKAAKPRPAKPSNIIAQVEGSGTLLVGLMTLPPVISPALVNEVSTPLPDNGAM
jgi:hypothetical protein